MHKPERKNLKTGNSNTDRETLILKEGQISYDIAHMWNTKKWYKQPTYLQNRKRVTAVENNGYLFSWLIPLMAIRG